MSTTHSERNKNGKYSGLFKSLRDDFRKQSDYTNALANISKVIEVFQANNILTYHYPGNDSSNDFSFRIELHTVPFEQLSYIWGY
jgi:predicted SPOUT superfamily RNA methylase MTH1